VDAAMGRIGYLGQQLKDSSLAGAIGTDNAERIRRLQLNVKIFHSPVVALLLPIPGPAKEGAQAREHPANLIAF
jgi:hypothetical protein